MMRPDELWARQAQAWLRSRGTGEAVSEFERAGKLWNAQELVKLQGLISDGMSLQRICEVLQRPPLGVVHKLCASGWTTKSKQNGYQIYLGVRGTLHFRACMSVIDGDIVRHSHGRPVMNNQMQVAFAEAEKLRKLETPAGLTKVTAISKEEQVWNIIKNFPGITKEELLKRVDMPAWRMQKILWRLDCDGSVKSDRSGRGPGSAAKYTVLTEKFVPPPTQARCRAKVLSALKQRNSSGGVSKITVDLSAKVNDLSLSKVNALAKALPKLVQAVQDANNTLQAAQGELAKAQKGLAQAVEALENAVS